MSARAHGSMKVGLEACINPNATPAEADSQKRVSNGTVYASTRKYSTPFPVISLSTNFQAPPFGIVCSPKCPGAFGFRSRHPKRLRRRHSPDILVMDHERVNRIRYS